MSRCSIILFFKRQKCRLVPLCARLGGLNYHTLSLVEMASSIPVARRVIEGTQQALQNAHVKLGASLLVNAQNNSFLKTRVDFFQRLFSKQERRLEGSCKFFLVHLIS